MRQFSFKISLRNVKCKVSGITKASALYLLWLYDRITPIYCCIQHTARLIPFVNSLSLSHPHTHTHTQTHTPICSRGLNLHFILTIIIGRREFSAAVFAWLQRHQSAINISDVPPLSLTCVGDFTEKSAGVAVCGKRART